MAPGVIWLPFSEAPFLIHLASASPEGAGSSRTWMTGCSSFSSGFPLDTDPSRNTKRVVGGISPRYIGAGSPRRHVPLTGAPGSGLPSMGWLPPPALRELKRDRRPSTTTSRCSARKGTALHRTFSWAGSLWAPATRWLLASRISRGPTWFSSSFRAWVTR